MRRGSDAQKSQNTIRRKLRKLKKFKIGYKEKRGLTICCTGEIRAEEENAVYYLKGIRKLIIACQSSLIKQLGKV